MRCTYRVERQQCRLADENVEWRQRDVRVMGMKPQACSKRYLPFEWPQQISQRSTLRIVPATRHHPVARLQLIFSREHEASKLGDDFQALNRGIVDSQYIRSMKERARSFRAVRDAYRVRIVSIGEDFGERDDGRASEQKRGGTE